MIQPIIILLLIGIIFLTKECSTNTTKYIPVVSTVTKVIPVKYDKWYPAPYPITHIDSFERPQKIDSSDVVDSFYKANIYNRLICDDTNAKLYLKDTITQNKLRAFKLSGTFYRRETTITNTIVQPLKNRVYIGFKIGSDTKDFTLMPSIVLLTKKDKIQYNYQYDPFTEWHYIGMDFKIHLW